MITFLFDSVFSWVVTVPVAAVLCLTTPLSVFVIYAIVQSLDLIKVAIGYGLIRKGFGSALLSTDSKLCYDNVVLFFDTIFIG